MGDCSYRWYKYNFNTSCIKCGNKIAMQSPLGAPECDDCGELSKHSWEEMLTICDLKDLRRNGVGHKKIFSVMEANVNSENVSTINCYHCKTAMLPKTDLIESKSCECPKCNELIGFETLSSYKDFVFYRYVNQKISTANKSALIAVRCAACGAPLQTDPTKTNYTCEFCSVENILPPSLRHRRVLDDVYIGIQKKMISPKNVSGLTNPQQIINCLKENKKEAFNEGDLNALMVKFPENLQIYHHIANDLRHEFSLETFEKLWATSKSVAFLKIIGKKLNRSEADISSQIKKFDTNYKQYPKNSNTKKEGGSFFDKLKSLFN